MVSESIVKPEAAPLEELLSFSTAPSDGVLDELMQNYPIAGLGEKTMAPASMAHRLANESKKAVTKIIGI